MGDRLSAVWTWTIRSFLQIFPLPLRGTAAEYAEACVTDPAAISNIQVAEDAIAKAADDVASSLADRAREMLQQEDQRQASVMGRAQSLFFAVALLSSLLSIGAGFLVSSRTPHFGELPFISALALFLVIQVTLLVLSLTRAISGLIYPRAGASDFAKWAGCGGVGDLHRNEIISVLRWYRLSAHINTWRFSCLERALRSLRNVVIGSGLLVLAVLVFANIPSRPHCMDRTEFRGGTTIRYSVECPIERLGQP